MANRKHKREQEAEMEKYEEKKEDGGRGKKKYEEKKGVGKNK
jgi:hypothetical protein